ncbi:site-specific integrase [Liquorilactobacillus mali]|uniref:site-specific integrase n=1 Tax=Liquorilactobacillus mali TaxID=1618 RepID=UPI002654DA7F|nr:site-specific integrase [Liquorilactobacillus mali]MDN7145172.1 site-specific integrase [Liquorilactobacillus mali]
MASIKKYKNKKGTFWRFQVFEGRDSSGKQKVSKRQGFITKKEAKIAAAQLEEKIRNNGFSDSSKITFKEVYEAWFKLYKNTVRESTWTKTREIFELHILPVFGNIALSKITTMQCQQAVDKWFADGFTKYKVFINNVSRIFKYAKRMKLIIENPVDNVIKPRDKAKPITTMKNNFYDRGELQHFLKCLYDEDNMEAYTFFRLLAFSGLRKSEALALTYNDINFEKNTVNVNKTQSRGESGLIINSPKTFESNRTVFIDLKTIDIIKKWRFQQKQELMYLGFNSLQPNQLVFNSAKNTMLQPVKPTLWLQHCIQKYDLKHITTHGFRHTYATLAIESGLSIKQVQQQLGHRDFKTTMDIYAALTNQKKNEIAAKFTSYVDF